MEGYIDISCVTYLFAALFSSPFFYLVPWLVSKPVKKKGFGNCMIFQHPATLIPLGHGIKAKIHTCREIAFRFSNGWGSRNNSTCNLVFPGPRPLLHWEICHSSMSMGTYYNHKWLNSVIRLQPFCQWHHINHTFFVITYAYDCYCMFLRASFCLCMPKLVGTCVCACHACVRVMHVYVRVCVK